MLLIDKMEINYFVLLLTKGQYNISNLYYD